ncbi:hypothetical protein FRC0190_02233 [Corynebacterium rouxii]|uniref:Uncharacterized protein n=1 Tax=Corynebacterium rouxii TaxID=2719119 RepID=A0A6I8MIS3_9CORY|nr:hypothetical protein FRC0190_02233 [Corynebacterium rouxii]
MVADGKRGSFSGNEWPGYAFDISELAPYAYLFVHNSLLVPVNQSLNSLGTQKDLKPDVGSLRSVTG